MLILPWQTRYIFGWSYLSGAPTEFGTLSLYASQVLLVLALMFIWGYHGRPSFRPGTVRWLGLGAVILSGCLLSARFAPQSVPALAALLDLAGASLLLVALLDRRVNLRVVLLAFALGLCGPVLLGLWQMVTGGSAAASWLGLATRNAETLGDAVLVLGDGSRVLRAYGSFPHPNVFGGYLSLGLLVVIWNLYELGRRSFAVARWQLVGLLVLALVLGAGLLLTASRSALLGLGVALVLMFLALKFRSFGWRPAWLHTGLASAVIAIVLALMLWQPGWIAALRGGGVTEVRSLSERAEQYQEFVGAMYGFDWLIGSGLRNYVFAVAEEHPTQSVWDYQPIHNVPLLILAELGLIGLLLIVVWLALLDIVNYARFFATEAILAHGLGKVLFVIAFFDHYLWSSWAGLALVAIAAAALWRLGERSTDSA
jgi:hypothetical protein